MTKAVISIGSNLGDRLHYLEFAFTQIEKLSQTQTIARSSIYETTAIGGPEQDAYLNAIVLVETDLEPLVLLTALQDIETAAMRTRDVKWGPRTLDLDIVDYENFNSNTDELQIPHPRAKERRFVLEPLAEIDADWNLSEQKVSDLLKNVANQNVTKWKA
jgi:2-amino-4-hydroxy-6-hydroxymethyldihydropteridine diphosphokinase